MGGAALRVQLSFLVSLQPQRAVWVPGELTTYPLHLKNFQVTQRRLGGQARSEREAEGDALEAAALREGEYVGVRRFTRTLERGGDAKAVVDALVDRCGALLNLRTEILLYRRPRRSFRFYRCRSGAVRALFAGGVFEREAAPAQRALGSSALPALQAGDQRAAHGVQARQRLPGALLHADCVCGVPGAQPALRLRAVLPAVGCLAPGHRLGACLLVLRHVSQLKAASEEARP